MYESPINIYELTRDIQQKINQDQEEKVMECICEYGINVDKEELIKALKYDRHQYNKGYRDGYEDGKEQEKWIPCSERLPEESITVIGVTTFYDIYKTELYDDCGEKKWYANGDYDVPIVAWMPFPQSYTEIEKDSTYQKELNDVRQELLSRPDQYITFRDLVERFDDVDAEFNHSSWNLLQIYSNFNILIGTEREEEI